MRTYDAELVAPAIKLFLKSEDLVNPVEWMSNPDNIALMHDDDIALFEKGVKDVYSGHYYFTSRGRAAIKSSKIFLDELFNTCYNIHVLIGLTPLTNLGARWMSRQVGFKSYGIVRVNNKPYEMFIITKREFNQQMCDTVTSSNGVA